MGSLNRYGTIVIGAGPAGLFCALSTRRGKGGVLLLERNTGPGSKLLLSGSGQCNFTHSGPIEEFTCRYGRATNFVKPSLYGFSNTALVDFIESRGVATTVREDGKVFPASMRATDVLSALLGQCIDLGVEIRYDSRVLSVSHDRSGFTAAVGNESFLSDSLVISTGGCSYPETGSTGDGYVLAESLGHTVTDVTEALAPVSVRDPLISSLAGISVRNAGVRLIRGGRRADSGQGDVLFTGNGLSGPGILDLSRSVRKGDQLLVSMTGTDSNDAGDRLAEGLEGGRTIRNVLKNMGVPARLSDAILKRVGIDPARRGGEVSGAQRMKLFELLTSFPFTVEGKGGFGAAMATAGGVRRDEINRHTMESRVTENLYFAGEIIDVDGDTGGYNIQWAFSSGRAAGTGIIRKQS